MDDDGKVVVLADRRAPPAEPVDCAVLCEVAVMADGDVTIWLSNRLETASQFNWLFAKLAGASGNIFMEKLKRTESE